MPLYLIFLTLALFSFTPTKLERYAEDRLHAISAPTLTKSLE